jgi:hypothetical protein
MSRYPAFGGPAGGYDESLLQMAPKITKADRQQGYSVDILEQGRQSNFQYGANAPRRQPVAQGYEQPRFQQRQQPSSSNNHSSPPSLEKADYYSSSTSGQRDIFQIKPYKPAKPWYRTKRGLVIIFIIILVLAGGAVGIVFGIRATSNRANADRGPPQNGAQSRNGGGGAATSAERGGGAASSNVLPALPSLSLITLGNGQQSVANTPSRPPNLALTLKVNSAPAATAPQTPPAATTPAQARVASSSVGPTPTQAARVTVASVGPTPRASSVDPICSRFPSLPSCQ